MTRNRRRFLFADKIQEVYQVDFDSAWANANIILKTLPDALIPNVEQWISGEPLSEIRVRGYSVPMLLSLWRNDDFLSAARLMMELTTEPERAERQIWSMRR